MNAKTQRPRMTTVIFDFAGKRTEAARIPLKLWNSAKRHAAQQGVSVDEFFSIAICELLRGGAS